MKYAQYHIAKEHDSGCLFIRKVRPSLLCFSVLSLSQFPTRGLVMTDNMFLYHFVDH